MPEECHFLVLNLLAFSSSFLHTFIKHAATDSAIPSEPSDSLCASNDCVHGEEGECAPTSSPSSPPSLRRLRAGQVLGTTTGPRGADWNVQRPPNRAPFKFSGAGFSASPRRTLTFRVVRTGRKLQRSSSSLQHQKRTPAKPSRREAGKHLGQEPGSPVPVLVASSLLRPRARLTLAPSPTATAMSDKGRGHHLRESKGSRRLPQREGHLLAKPARHQAGGEERELAQLVPRAHTPLGEHLHGPSRQERGSSPPF